MAHGERLFRVDRHYVTIGIPRILHHQEHTSKVKLGSVYYIVIRLLMNYIGETRLDASKTRRFFGNDKDQEFTNRSGKREN